MGHIPIKLHQFLNSSFRDFMRTDTHTHTDTQTPPITIPTRSMRAGKNDNLLVLIMLFNTARLYLEFNALPNMYADRREFS